MVRSASIYLLVSTVQFIEKKIIRLPLGTRAIRLLHLVKVIFCTEPGKNILN